MPRRAARAPRGPPDRPHHGEDHVAARRRARWRRARAEVAVHEGMGAAQPAAAGAVEAGQPQQRADRVVAGLVGVDGADVREGPDDGREHRRGRPAAERGRAPAGRDRGGRSASRRTTAARSAVTASTPAILPHARRTRARGGGSAPRAAPRPESLGWRAGSAPSLVCARPRPARTRLSLLRLAEARGAHDQADDTAEDDDDHAGPEAERVRPPP